jgi:hypothetical protein
MVLALTWTACQISGAQVHDSRLLVPIVEAGLLAHLLAVRRPVLLEIL